MSQRDNAYWVGQGLGLAAWAIALAIGPLDGSMEWAAFGAGVLFGAAAVLMLWRRGER